MKHSLKILPQHFAQWLCRMKTCELRRNDRVPPFEIGDYLRLCEWLPDNGAANGVHTGREITVRVLSVLRDHEGLAPGYCLMSCEEVKT